MSWLYRYFNVAFKPEYMWMEGMLLLHRSCGKKVNPFLYKSCFSLSRIGSHSVIENYHCSYPSSKCFVT
jgi:hypothetical protein